MTLKDARALAPNLVEYDERPRVLTLKGTAPHIGERRKGTREVGDQLEIDFSKIDFDLDRPQLSLCPKCSGDIIRLADGCRICGWSENESPLTQTRRRKGEGTGYIYRRTVTRKGKQYQEAYYRYRDESGKLRSKYIPRKLIDRVEEADNSKLPVTEVLRLLGGEGISRGEPELEIISRGEQLIPPSTKRRDKGRGTGYIECKSITRNGKQYKQYWFHWEEWREGDRVVKKSRYIPKNKVSKVERMNDEKVPVEKILKVLETKSQRRK